MVTDRNNITNKPENDDETRKSNKTPTKKDPFPPLPLVNSPQKLSRKNFDKHKISTALLKVTFMSNADNYGFIFIFIHLKEK